MRHVLSGSVPQVAEHLRLYAAIKGYSRHDAGAIADEAARDVGLGDKLATRAGELSGGQRRKLSVALAFLGVRLRLELAFSGVCLPGMRLLSFQAGHVPSVLCAALMRQCTHTSHLLKVEVL